MNQRSGGAIAALLVLMTSVFSHQTQAGEAPSVESGRYLVRVTGCNDCHTAGYGGAMGNIPESEWLKGDILGWRGPWGTTYSPNLRLSLAALTEDQWVAYARNLQSRPPMPSYSLNNMTEEDLRSIYRFIRQLEPLGEPAPTYLPPDVEPRPPFVQFPAPPPAE
jgi:mono/diheme cytochrome c family protein